MQKPLEANCLTPALRASVNQLSIRGPYRPRSRSLAGARSPLSTGGDDGRRLDQLVEEHDRALDADGHRARRDGRAGDDLNVLVGLDGVAGALADELRAEAIVAHFVAARFAVD